MKELCLLALIIAAGYGTCKLIPVARSVYEMQREDAEIYRADLARYSKNWDDFYKKHPDARFTE